MGGQDLAFDYSSAKIFRYTKDWITLENISSHTKNGLSSLGENELNVISLDLDGNDICFTEELPYQNISSKLFLAEYNAKFIPSSRFQIAFNPQHQ